jgi:hypothetical protein
MELALASRILAKQGVVDAFGHCSTRHPGAPHTVRSLLRWRA